MLLKLTGVVLFLFALAMVAGGFVIIIYALTNFWLGRTWELMTIGAMLIVAGGIALIVARYLIKSSSYQMYANTAYLDEFDEEDGPEID